MIPRARRVLVAVVAVLVIVGGARLAGAQVFLSAQPHPEFTIAPLFVSTSITRDGAPPHLTVFWNVSVTPGSRQAAPSHLLLLLPFAIAEPAKGLAGDAELASYVTTRGFTVDRQGAVPIVARNRTDMGSGRPPQSIGTAPYVTFVRESAARGRSRPASLLRVPWSTHLASTDWLVGLDMLASDLIRPKPASWYEDAFFGPRHIVSVSFGDLRHQALYPFYFEHREHVVAVGRDFSMLSINFADADHLRIDQLTPTTANRQPSESRRNTETVSVPLAGGEGIVPQVVRVNYGYFTGRFEWRPILISLLFLLVGNITGPVVVPLVKRLARGVSARVFVGAEPARENGVILDRATLGKLKPGESTADDVFRLLGTDCEDQQQQRLPGEARRTLRYRGERRVPQRSWRVGNLAHVRRWDLEIHEVDVELQDDRVADVQARVRRARWVPAAGA
jgi:hypothetical protein